MTNSPTETTIVREIAIHAPAARVFSALTEPKDRDDHFNGWLRVLGWLQAYAQQR
jgi:uncharacterized protein YndB with AHSA1/START domain